MNNLPRFESYGPYQSKNYGVNALVFNLGAVDVYFSYKTPVAFRAPGYGLVCRVNDWSQTTGKHLNAIQPDKTKRISGAEFEAQLAQVISAQVAGLVHLEAEHNDQTPALLRKQAS